MIKFMVNRIKAIFYVLLCYLSMSSMAARGQAGPDYPIWNAAGPVLFLGNSITYAGQYVAMTESLMLMTHPESKPMFINLGLPSETLSGLSEPNHADGKFPRPCLFDRLDNLLAKISPAVVFVCYGMNDGIYLPFDEVRFEAYKTGVLRLQQRLLQGGAKRIIWMTPPVHDDPKQRLGGYNLVLDRYASWLLGHARQEHWEVIDLHAPMSDFLEQEIAADSTFRLAADGVHPGTLGHWLMAKAIVAHLLPELPLEPTWEDQCKRFPKLHSLYSLLLKRETILKDAYLSDIGHKRPGMVKGKPLDEAHKIYKQLQKEIAGR